MTEMSDRTQTAYTQGHIDTTLASLDDIIQSAMYQYLREDLGLSESVAKNRALSEIQGTIGRMACDECEEAGLTFQAKKVLDLGAGLGGLSAEIVRRGALLIAIEPANGWRGLAAKRLAAIGNGTVIGAVGEQLPIADDSIDLIISLQVLEHVQNPRKVIFEAFRVLKPGGHIYMTFENYLSFWEPHYRIRWLPLLPKWIGAVYLKALGKNPKFLHESITYVTFPGVRRYFFEAGFECMRAQEYQQALHSPYKKNIKWKLMKALAYFSEPLALRVLAAADYVRRMFRTGAHEFMRKPARYSD